MDETVLLYDDLEDISESTNNISSEIGTALPKSVEHLGCKAGSNPFGAESSSAANDDLDLYSELLSADNKERCEKEKQDKEDHEKLVKEATNLRTENCALKTEVQLLRTQNKTLKQNISSLYKTAKTEIDFKNQLIVELRQELDGYIFRRKMYNNRYESPERRDELKYSRHSKNEGNFDKDSHHKKKEKFISEHRKQKNDSELHESGNNANFCVKQTCNKDGLAMKDQENVTHLEKNPLNKSSESVSVSLQEGFDEFKSKQAVAIAELNNAFSSFERTQTQLTESLKETVFQFYGVQAESVKHNAVCEQVPHCSSDKRYYSMNSLNSINQYDANSLQEKYLSNNKTYDDLEHVPVKRAKLSSSTRDTFQMHSEKHNNGKETEPDNSTNATRMHSKVTPSPRKSKEKFSSSLKNDVLKLYHYHNAAVPFAVKKRLNLSPFKKNSRCEKSNKKINSSSEPLHKLDAESNSASKSIQNRSVSGHEPQNFSKSGQCTSKSKCDSINDKHNSAYISSNSNMQETALQVKSSYNKDTILVTSDKKNIPEKEKTEPEMPGVLPVTNTSESPANMNEQLMQKQRNLESSILSAEKSVADACNINYDKILDFALNMLNDELTEESTVVENDETSEVNNIGSAANIPDTVPCSHKSNDKRKCEEQVTEQVLKDVQQSSINQISGSKKRKKRLVRRKTQTPETQLESVCGSNSHENQVNTSHQKDSYSSFKKNIKPSLESPSFDASGFHCATVFSRRLINRYVKEEEEEKKKNLKRRRTSPRKAKKKKNMYIK